MRALHAAVTLALVAVATASLLEAATLADLSPAHRPKARQSVAGWEATLEGKDGRKVTGRATAAPGTDGRGMEITVSIDGDTPGATRPWHVHSGSCRQGGGVVGAPRAYPPLAVDLRGQGRGSATIAVPLTDTAAYYVNIHDSAAAMGIIVACGDLLRK
jgi:hypothetical protein